MSIQHNPADVLYSRVVVRLREGGLTAQEVAHLTGVSERQVHRWSTGASRPEGDARHRLLEVNYVVEQLREIYTDEGVEIWLHGRNKALDGRRPIQLLQSGEFEPVLAIIEALNEGAM
ncbi:MAG TPA: antitoxin Xre/MbcA/ParS toxin-binding domain-containing protein [Mycobacteriales bacterium]|nr:antitoxin Xre/MbcA/ParS toxin-binding domain-containing protein [Mycobacteriales bacterium]